MPRMIRTPLIAFDAGWLFLLPGLALLAATVLLPAYNDLRDARWVQTRAAAIEKSRLERVDHYGLYLDALGREDPSVVASLAASQLNLIPESFEPLAPPRDPASLPATVFPWLEPEPNPVPEHRPVANISRLESWATNDRTRVWLIAAGGMCVLIGLLPAARAAPPPAPAKRRAAQPTAADSPTSPASRPSRVSARKRPQRAAKASNTARKPQSQNQIQAPPSDPASSTPGDTAAPAAPLTSPHAPSSSSGAPQASTANPTPAIQADLFPIVEPKLVRTSPTPATPSILAASSDISSAPVPNSLAPAPTPPAAAPPTEPLQ